MNAHSRAKMTPSGRELLVRRVLQEGWPRRRAAEAGGVSVRTTSKWLSRYRQEGLEGLRDRSSRPNRSPRRTRESVVRRILDLRRKRLTALALSETTGIPRSTIGRLLRRERLSRYRDLLPKEPVFRYEHPRPGDLLHMDTKKLGRVKGIGHRITGDRRSRNRGIGWEFVHVAIDDHSRLAYVEVLADELAVTTAGFLQRALAYFQGLGITTHRTLTDNGGNYRSKILRALCEQRGIRQRFTQPYHPRTNGKAERFIQTLLRQWAYRRPYSSSKKRSALLPRWLHFYNHHRKHSSLGGRPPFSRVNNLMSTNS